MDITNLSIKTRTIFMAKVWWFLIKFLAIPQITKNDIIYIPWNQED